MCLGLFTMIFVWGEIGGNKAIAQDQILVDCNTNDTITAALSQAAPGTTILVSGLCNESLTITKDEIIIDGQNQTTIDGQGASASVILIDGARRVTIRNLTVQNGVDGLRAQSGASVTLENVIATNNSDDGIQIVGNSTGQLSDCVAQNNGSTGILVVRNANVSFFGTIRSQGNNEDGLLVSLSSSVFTANSMLSITENGRIGLFVANSSSMQINGGVVDIINNDDDGVTSQRTSSIELSGGSRLTSQGNSEFGILVAFTSTIVCFNNSTIISSNNLVGNTSIEDVSILDCTLTETAVKSRDPIDVVGDQTDGSGS